MVFDDDDDDSDEATERWVDDLLDNITYNRSARFLGAWAKEVAPMQKDPYYLSWLAMIPEQLDLYFIPVDIDFECDPFTREGLLVAEKKFLEYYPSIASVWTDVDQETKDRSTRFVMYLGETLRRNFDIRWVNLPDEELEHGIPFGVGPWGIDALYDYWNMLTATAHRRTGDEWAQLWDYVTISFNRWKKAGTIPVWEEPSCRIFD